MKRFIIIQDEDNFTVRDTLKNRHMGMFEFKEDEFPIYFCFHKIIDLLNALHEENIKLKKENEQLKKELKIYRNVANCSNCEYQNYDWYDDGDEFEICERGNNEQQIEYHICKDWREL